MMLIEQSVAPLQFVRLEQSHLQAVQDDLILGAGHPKFFAHAPKLEKSEGACPAKRVYAFPLNYLHSVMDWRCSSDYQIAYLTASLTCKFLELPEILSSCSPHLISSVGQIFLSELCPVTPSRSAIQTPGSTLSGSIVFLPIRPHLSAGSSKFTVGTRCSIRV